MTLSNPLIRLAANRLCDKGRIDEEQRESLLRQDSQFNIIIAVGVLCVVAKILFF